MLAALVVVPLALLVLGFPIFVVLLGAALTYVGFFATVPPTVLHQVLYGGLDNYPLLAIPFFLFAGEVMARGGIARRIVDWILALIGGVRGSLAVTTVGTAAVFGSMSGSGPADTATVGRLLLPALHKAGYDERFAAGLVTSIGAVAIVIPPSIAMILFGASAEQSVPRLFAAGVLPGLLISGVVALYCVWYARAKGIREGGRFGLGRFLRATASGAWALGMPFFILGGIYGGLFAPTEAAGAASVYAVLVARYAYRDVTWRQLWEIASDTMFRTAQIMIVVGAAAVFSWMLTISGAAGAAGKLIAGIAQSPWLVLLLINVLLLVVGCFIDPTSAILVLTPLLMPIVKQAGIDPIHFGIVMTVNLSIGLFTPPFGLNIFVAQSVLRIPLGTIYLGLRAFIALQIAALLVISYVPAISLWLTRFVG
jgi:C4-dicarboxylate transporter DctM subunit